MSKRKPGAAPIGNSAGHSSEGLFRLVRKDAKFLGIVVGSSLLLHLLHLLFIRGMPNFACPVMDSLDYIRTAGLSLDPRHVPEAYYHSPLYPWFIATILRVFGPHLLLIRLFQIGIAGLTMPLVYAVGYRLFSKPVARVTTVLYAFYGPLLFYNCEILHVSLILFWNLLGFYLVLRAVDRPALWRFAVAGLVFGLAAVTRADILPFVLLVALAVAILPRLTRAPAGMRLAYGAAMLLGAACLLVPVGIRNYAVSGQFVVLPTNGGLNFYQGNNPRYKQTIGIRLQDWYTLAHMPLAEGVGTELNELGHGDFYYAKAKQYMRNSPADYLRCLWYKIRVLSNGYELPETFDLYTAARYSPVLHALTWRVGALHLPFGLLLPLAIVGLYLSRRNVGSLWLLALLASLLISLIGYWNSSRYRLCIAPVLMWWAAAALVWLAGRARERSWGQLGGALLAVMALAVPVNWPLEHFSKQFNFDAELRTMAGLALARDNQQLGQNPHLAFLPHDPKRGLELLKEAAELAPDSIFAHNHLGEVLMRQNQFDAAIFHFQQAINCRENFYPGYDNLGRALGQSGRFDEAIQAFEKVLAIYPRSYDTLCKLGLTHQLKGDADPSPYYRRALEINPKHVEAHMALARILLSQDPPLEEEAAGHLRAVVQVNPQQPQARALLAEMARRQQASGDSGAVGGP